MVRVGVPGADVRRRTGVRACSTGYGAGVPGENAVRSDGDRELLDLVRAGDLDAYGELYARYSGGAHRFARSLVANRTDADDAVAEVFASLLGTLQRGRGPTDLFLPYLLTSIRNECHRINRRGSREAVSRFDRLGSVLDARRHHADPVSELAEAEVITTALSGLPDNLRDILWRTEVREEPAREIAAQRGATPHAVAETALRARRALGSAYLQLHAAGGSGVDDLEAACRDARPYLAAYVRRSVGAKRRRHIERHLLTCEDCADAHEELGRVNRRLRIAPILPIDAGVATIGIKAQVAAWLAASAAPIAASGMVLVTVLGPVAHDPDERPAVPPVVVVVGAGGPVPAPASPVTTTIVVDRASLPDGSSSPRARPSAGSASKQLPSRRPRRRRPLPSRRSRRRRSLPSRRSRRRRPWPPHRRDPRPRRRSRRRRPPPRRRRPARSSRSRPSPSSRRPPTARRRHRRRSRTTAPVARRVVRGAALPADRRRATGTPTRRPSASPAVLHARLPRPCPRDRTRRPPSSRVLTAHGRRPRRLRRVCPATPTPPRTRAAAGSDAASGAAAAAHGPARRSPRRPADRRSSGGGAGATRSRESRRSRAIAVTIAWRPTLPH